MKQNKESKAKRRKIKIKSKKITIKCKQKKVGPSLSKKCVFIYFNESPLKMMKNAFYFMLKALFVVSFLRYLHFCPDFWI